MSPDVVLVEMNGESRVPEWLENLPQEMPHTHVLVCSYNREPDFLIRAMQVGIREFLPLPLTQGDLESALNRVRSARKQLIPVENREGRIIVVTGHKGGVGEHHGRRKPGTGSGGIGCRTHSPDRLGAAVPRCGNLPGPGIKLFHRGPDPEYCQPG